MTKTKTKTKKARLVRIELDLHEPLQKLATEDRRSFAAYVNLALRGHVAKAKGKRK